MPNRRQVSGTRFVAAPPEDIFALLTDPSQHPVLDGSGTVQAARSGGPDRLELGTRFGMDMKLGAPYKILNTVVEYEENRLIAWRHFNGHRWRWELTPVDGGTEVTETFDWSTARVPVAISLSFFPRRNKEGIERTLDRLAGMFPG
ncbi:SRPBCC family protein [Amycolatopsis sp. GM8]|uniref:SRPBCC family protein n=1 Tax=Amycolatopsis sp. GM8 TaxID=2896530 RepID=UPI001F16758A|nr:SRPBCC family protein [Amycolatopsis sp. GM8]